jgi:hypothetical protein
VPGAIVAAKQTNAQARARELIIIFVNFVFIVVVFFCLSFCCVGLLWLFIVRSHFWPFTRVLRRIWPFVTQKVV